MKKLLILALALCAMGATAQTRKGTTTTRRPTTAQTRKPATAKASPQQKTTTRKDPAEAVATIGVDVTWPLFGIMLGQQKIPFGEPGNYTGKVTLRTYHFNGYTTVMAECDQKDFNQEIGHIQTYFWSGKGVECTPQNNNEVYLILKRKDRSAYTAPIRGGALTYVKDQKLAVLQVAMDHDANVVGDMWRGMSVDELAKKLSTLRGLKFENAGTEKGLNVWVAKWFQITDDYRDIYGTMHSSFDNDKEYGRFYFDANGKLVVFYLKG